MTILEQYKSYQDKDLIVRILEGETSLYEVIIRRYNPYLFKVGRSYGFSQPDTEDLMQDTFIKAYSNIGSFEHRSSLKTWLVRIMLNTCYHKKRKTSYKKVVTSNEIEHLSKRSMGTTGSITASTVMNNELKQILEKSLASIPEDYRIVFTLRELNGMSTAETSEALEISETNVKIRFFRSKMMLRKEIEKFYSPEEIFEFNLIYCNRIVHNVLRSISRPSPKSLRFNLGKLKYKIHSWLAGAD